MSNEAKRCVETCREWYQAFANFQRGDERSVKDLLAVADLIESLSAELEQVKQEMDALLDDFKLYRERNIKHEYGVYACDLCKHGIVYSSGGACRKKGCHGMKHWEWRGAREEA